MKQKALCQISDRYVLNILCLHLASIQPEWLAIKVLRPVACQGA